MKLKQLYDELGEMVDRYPEANVEVFMSGLPNMPVDGWDLEVFVSIKGTEIQISPSDADAVAEDLSKSVLSSRYGIELSSRLILE